MFNKKEIKNPIIYGLIASFCCFLLLIILQKGVNINPLGGKKETGFIFVILAMIFAIKAVRTADGGGISFKKGYGICFLTTIIASVFSLGFLYIFLEFISTNTLSNYINITTTELIKNKEQIIKNGIPITAYDDALTNIKITNLKSILIDDFMKKIFLSIIPSLMISLYFRRRFIS